MTTSVAKGSKSESSTAHNDRKTILENAPEDKRKKFYEQKGHEHIIEKYTHLNEDMIIKDKRAMYDELFEDAIKKYNDTKTRDDRKIGGGKAYTRAEKRVNIELITRALEVRKMKKADRTKFIDSLDPKNAMQKDLKAYLQATSKLTRRDIRKQLTQAKHAKTLGEAYYLKQYHSKQSSTHREFLMQIGNEADFNEMDPNNPKRILKSYDREDPNGIWQRSKHVLEEYVNHFEERNPNLKICNASIHMDEQTPHVQLQVIPVADSEKMMMRGNGTKDKETGKVTKKARHTGLAVKNSFNGALECEGYERKVKDNRDQFTQWASNEQQELAKLMQKELGITRKRGKTNHFKNVHEYKEYQRQVEQQIDQINSYKAEKHKQVEVYKSNKKILDKQNKKLAENQSKLDDLDNYESLMTTYQTNANTAKQEQKDAEKKRDKALQVQKEAEKAKKLAEEQARNANQMLINSLNARKRDLDNRENGYKDSKGIYHKGIKDREKDATSRESNVINRETAVTEKENNLANYDSQIKEKKTILADYEKNLEAKKQKILDKKNKELQESYKAKKQKLDNAYSSRKDEFVSDLKSLQRQKKQLAESNETQSKFVTYASFVYHKCAETFIKTIDPETDSTYNNGFHESKNTMAYDMAHGNYHDAMNPGFSGKNGLENCIQEYHINNNRKRLWSALKATGKKFAELINTKQAKTLIRQLDEIDESGISEEAVKQADNVEIKRQQAFWKQQEQEKQQQRNRKLHIGLRPVAKNDDLENPYDN